MVGTPVPNSHASAGRFQISQCTQVPLGASGSSAMRAKLRVPVGTPVQANGSDWFLPSQVNTVGTAAPSVSAELVSRNPLLPDASREAVMVSKLHPLLPPRHVSKVTGRRGSAGEI